MAEGLRAIEYIEIDHPWISNDLMPVYRCTFPPEATLEALDAFFRARDDWAIRVRYHFAWVFDLSTVTKAPATHRTAYHVADLVIARTALIPPGTAGLDPAKSTTRLSPSTVTATSILAPRAESDDAGRPLSSASVVS